MTTPRGHAEASRPPEATTRRDPSATASTSAAMRLAILVVSICTVASSSALVSSFAFFFSLSHVSSAALRVGFSARVATEARRSCWRRASTRVNTCCADARLSATDCRT
jgi:hypothetical protein